MIRTDHTSRWIFAGSLVVTLLVSAAPAAHGQSEVLPLTGALDDSRLSRILGDIRAALDGEDVSGLVAGRETQPVAGNSDDDPAISTLASQRDIDFARSALSFVARNVEDRMAQVQGCSMEALNAFDAAEDVLAAVDLNAVERTAALSLGTDTTTVAGQARVLLADYKDFQSEVRALRLECGQ